MDSGRRASGHWRAISHGVAGPTGESGYAEEAAVDTAARGQHISTALMRSLLDLAAHKGLRFVDLTSRPSRDIASNLYRSLGFQLRATNCYRHILGTRPR